MKARAPDARGGGTLWVLIAWALALLVPADTGAQEVPGLELSGALVADAMGVVSGGMEGSWAGLYNVDIQAAFEGEELGWSGGRAFLYVLGNGGEDPTELVGDFQGVNNIAAPETWKVFEAWVEQEVWGGQASVRAGLYDLNSEFDVLKTAVSLINSSFGIGPDFSQSCLGGPSVFPTTSLALRVQAHLEDDLLIRAAVLDGVPGDPNDPDGTQIILRKEDGALLAGEAEWALHGGRAAVGLWGYTREFHSNRARVGLPGAGAEDGPSYGGYALVESRLFSESDPAQGLDGFLRVGAASGEVHRIGSYLGLGGSYTGLMPGRDEDELAVGLAAARNSDEFMAARRAVAAPAERWEVALEATYVLRPADWLTVQPDVQFVVNPGTEPGVDDALVPGVRVILKR